MSLCNRITLCVGYAVRRVNEASYSFRLPNDYNKAFRSSKICQRKHEPSPIAGRSIVLLFVQIPRMWLGFQVDWVEQHIQLG